MNDHNTNIYGYPALEVAFEQDIATYFPLAAGEVSVQFLKNLKPTVIIPVVKEEEYRKGNNCCKDTIL